MKIRSTLSLLVAMSVSTLAIAQTADTKGMSMKDMEAKDCMSMMDMNPKMCKEMMKGMTDKQSSAAEASRKHSAEAVVESVDAGQGKVTLAHGPVKSLGWPAMTMGFTVKDKALLDRLRVGEKVNVQFKKQMSEYVVTDVE